MHFDVATALRTALSSSRGSFILTPEAVYDWTVIRNRISELRQVVRDVRGSVAVLLPNGLEAICTIVACYIESKTFVCPNHRQPSGALSIILSSSGVGLVITSRAFSKSVRHRLPTFYVDTGESAPGRAAAASESDPKIACIVFTSGTTGLPKGVKVTRAGLSNFLSWKQDELLHLNASDCVLQKTPLHFDVALWEILLPIATGARVVTGSPQIYRDAAEIVDAAIAHGVTVLNVVPKVLEAILSTQDCPKLKGTSLRAVLVGGEELPVATMESFFQTFPAIDLINLYGPTETSIGCTAWRCEPSFRGSRVPIGRPIRGVVATLDTAHWQPDGEDAVGELIIEGIQVADGYVQDDRLGQSGGFLALSGSEGARAAYRTGDLVKRSVDGLLTYIGRVDSQIKLNGLRLELEGIEQLITASDAVLDVIVKKETTSGSSYLVAYVEFCNSISQSTYAREIEALKSRLLSALPPEHVPLHFRPVSYIPTNDVGKKARSIDMASLLIDFDAGVTAQIEDRRLDILLQCVGSRLGVPVRLTDSRASLGIDSLSLVALANELRSTFGFTIDLTQASAAESIGNWTLHTVQDVERTSYLTKVGAPPQIEQIRFLEELESDNPAYHVQFLLQFSDDVDLDNISDALAAIYSETDIYRARFVEENGFQFIERHEPTGRPITVLQVENWNWAGIFDEATKFATTLRFNPKDGNTIRWLVFANGSAVRAIAQVEHHYVHDGWSIGLFITLLKNYFDRAYREKAVEVGGPDYFDWCDEYDRRRRSSPFAERVDQYANALRDYAADCEIPSEAITTREDGKGSGALKHFSLPREIHLSLEAFSRRIGASLFSVYMAAFQLATSRTFGLEKFCVGTAFANRDPTYADTIGMFVNAVAIPARCVSGESHLDVIHRASRTLEHLSRYQDIPLVDVVRRLAPPGSGESKPIYQVMFAFHDSSVPDLVFGGTRAQMLPLHNGSAKNLLNVVCIPRRQQLRDAGTEALQSAGFEVLWERSAELSEATSDALREEFLRILHLWSSGSNAVGMHHRFAPSRSELSGRVAAFGDLIDRMRNFSESATIALILPDQSKITYRELYEAARGRANEFAKSDPSLKHVAVITASKTASTIEAILACLMSSRPFALIDPEMPAARSLDILRMINGANSHFDLKAPISNVTLVHSQSLPADTCYVVFTSGTTGAPKGVVGSLANLNQAVLSRLSEFPERPERLLVSLPLHFDVGLSVTLWALAAGGTVVLDDAPFSAARLDERIADAEATHINLVSSLYKTLLDHLSSESAQALKRVMVGGEALSADTVERHLSRLPAVPLTNEYGPTECSAYVTTKTFVAGSERSLPLRVSVGAPIVNCGVSVRSSDGTIAPYGTTGRLMVSGSCLTLGYLTDDGFLRLPRIEDAWYDTGDLAFITREGEIYVAGRADSQVKIGGYRIEPLEIAAVIRDMPGIADEAVLTWEGPHGPELWAFVVAPGEPESTARAIRDHLLRRIEMHKVPSYIRILKELPRLQSGKIDEARLRAAHTVGLSTDQRGETQAIRRLLLAEGLDLSKTFRENGYDSLQLIRLAHRLRSQGIANGALSLLYANAPVSQILNRVARPIAEVSAPTQRPEAWFLSAPLSDRNKFFQWRVFEVQSTPESARDALTTVVGNPDHYEVGPAGSELLRDGSFQCAVTSATTDDELLNIIKSTIAKLDLAGGQGRLCVVVQMPGRVLVVIVMHHLLVDLISWEIISAKLSEGIRAFNSRHSNMEL